MSIIQLHILLGTLGLASGFVAIGTRKGHLVHRSAGIGFLMFMGISVALGIVEAIAKPERITAIAGAFSMYLMITGWLAVKNKLIIVRPVEILFTIVVAGVSVSALYYGMQGFQSADGMKDGFPFQSYVFFGLLALFSVISDIRWYTRSNTLSKHRLTRHLCRMCLGMLIVEASVFLGQSDVFPAMLQRTEVLSLPLVIVGAVMFYWIYKLNWKKN